MNKLPNLVLVLGLVGLLTACPPATTNTPPSIKIAVPTNNSSISQTSIAVSGIASDDKGISSVQYTINGAARATAVGTNNWSFTASNLVIGNNVITAIATDASGVEASDTVNVTLTNVSNPFALTITKQGSGTGNITSNPSGISCGSSCTANYPTNTDVTLTATANAGSSFIGWGGSCSGANSTCTVTLSQARNVTATFDLTPPDTTPPTISISSPTNASTVQTATVNLSGTASDNVALSLIQITVNGGTRANAVGTTSWTYSATLTCGLNTIVAYAKDSTNLETSNTITITRNCGSFTLAPVYPNGQTNYPVAQGADTLYYVTLTPTAPFNTAANAFSSLTAAAAANIGTGTNQMRVFYQPTLSSGNQVAFVIKAGATVPLGATTITLNASAGGVNASVTINVNVLPCSSGC